MKKDRVLANQRDFKGVYIPKEIWCHPDLKAEEILVWGEVFALDNNFGCVVDNQHFCELFGWFDKNGEPQIRKVQTIIKRLKDKQLFSVEQDKRRNERTIRVLGKFRHFDDEAMSNLQKIER